MTTDGRQKPVLYLDVDDTLIMWNMQHDGVAAPGAKAFVEFVAQAFEVRWLTWWAPSGTMEPELRTRLSRILDVDEAILATFDHGKAFRCTLSAHWKTAAIDFAEYRAGRPFWWVEDGMNHYDRDVMRRRRTLKRFIPCNVSVDDRVLKRVHARLAGMPR